MRKKLLAKNTFSSLLFQVTTLVCGFILPRAILGHFGSDVNGLVNSISQFLQVIAFLELGVGSVVRSALYKPLAQKDEVQTSKLIASASRFFRRIAMILVVYTLGLIVFYPLLVRQEFGWLYIAALIGAMSISYFAQYYFGVVDRLLLVADQRGFVAYNAQTLTVILNTAACIVLIRMDASIQMVKLISSLIFLARPLALHWYVLKHYSINRHIQLDEEPIKQKWNGVAQHVAAVVLDGTDTIVLTLMATLSDVSVYSVYFMVVNGVKQLLVASTSGIQSLIGDMWAKRELDTLKSFFGWVEWSIHTGVTFIFTCTGLLLVPFISVYTSGISDANYIQPLFAVLITLANAMHCLRLPYNVMILAGGHFKQTQMNYVAAAVINIAISVLCVGMWGLIGVAIGTLAAMSYQTLWMVWYDSKNFIQTPVRQFYRQLAVDILSVVLICAAAGWLTMPLSGYIGWFILAVEVACISAVIIIAVNFVFYRSKMERLLNKALHGRSRKI